MNDPIVEEVRRIRDEHAAQFNYDVDAILADNRRLFVGGNHPRVSLAPRRIDTPITTPEPEPAITAK